jgi:hypothetical protein
MERELYSIDQARALLGGIARNTMLSVAYNIGSYFAGFLPTIVFSIFTVTGNLYAGLVYPICVLVISALVGAIFLPETRGLSLAKVR